MKYKVGDRVKIKNELEIGIKYYMENKIDWDNCITEMLNQVGKIATIKEVSHSKYKIDVCGYSWTDEMFEGLVDKNDKLIKGDVNNMPTYWGFNPDSYEIKIVTNLKENKVEVDYVIYNNPATIIVWSDGTKTVVKTTENDDYDPVVGFLMAYYQKHSGMTKTQVGKFMDKVIRDCQEQEEKRNKKRVG